MSMPAIAPDLVDLAELDAFLTTRAYAVYRAKIDGLLRRRQEKIEDSATPTDEMRACQGAIAELRHVLKLPGILRQEIRERTEGKNERPKTDRRRR